MESTNLVLSYFNVNTWTDVDAFLAILSSAAIVIAICIFIWNKSKDLRYFLRKVCFVNSNYILVCGLGSKAASYIDSELQEGGINIIVIEKDINRVALGQKAKITVDTYPGVEFEGQIENIAPIVEGRSRTLTVKIRIKNDNPRGTLLPGMFARIWVSVYEKKNTIRLPGACLYDLNNDGEFDSVYVVTSENIAKATPVRIGYVSTDYIEIIDGLREGEQVVSETMAELKDGVKVDVIEVQEPMF